MSLQLQNEHEILVSTATLVAEWVGSCAFLAALELLFTIKLKLVLQSKFFRTTYWPALHEAIVGHIHT